MSLSSPHHLVGSAPGGRLLTSTQHHHHHSSASSLNSPFNPPSFVPTPPPLPPGPLGQQTSSSSKATLSNRQVYILKGEIALSITSLWRTTQQRWTSQQDAKANYPLVKQLQALKESLNSNLKLALSKISQDANYFLLPFLEIIRSEDTSGPITAMALSSVEKFIINDMVNEANGGTLAAEAITDAVIHAHFVSTDSSSDELVLMKILQVLHGLFMSPLGTLLSNESVCELMQSCFRMCFIERANELLRKSAETALHDMVRLLFIRAGSFPVNLGRKTKILDPTLELAVEAKEEDESGVAIRTDTVLGGGDDIDSNQQKIVLEDQSGQENEEKLGTSEAQDPQDEKKEESGADVETVFSPRAEEEIDGGTLSTVVTPNPSVPSISIEHPTPQDTPAASKISNPNIVEFKNKRGILFTTASDTSLEKIEEVESTSETTEEQQSHAPSGQGVVIEDSTLNKPVNNPYGIPCVRELVRFLVSLINPYEKQNSETMIHLGLKLLLVAVESNMESIAMHPPLHAIFKNELVKNLIALLNYTPPNNNNAGSPIILLTVLRILFVIFETMRSDMKYQLEVLLTRLMEIIGDANHIAVSVNQSQQTRWLYEQKELVLEYLVELWKLPTFVTELYLNYDCDLFSSNLFEDLTKLLSKNAFPMHTGINSIHLQCLEGLASILDGIEVHCTTRLTSTNVNNVSASSGGTDESNSSVFYHDYEPGEVKLEKSEESGSLPTHEQLMAVRHKKKLYHSGSEQFNQNAGKGISFLQANGILSTTVDSVEIAQFLRENPLLDKKTIGDYISNKKRADILIEFVKGFDFKGTRLDEALRLFLETFRLPGEAPLISHILEIFAEVWTHANGNPFANVDAAYTLSYAVIMLNVDQHNSNVRQQCMTPEQFKKNLKGVNGGQEFDPNMLQEIYNAIRSEEIVMPAEHTGIVKENYLWKMLLRRATKSKYLSPKSDEGLYDHDLFSLSWGPIVAALSFIFDKTSDNAVITKTTAGFRKCATISAHYGMSDVFDNLVISLCKFTTLLSGSNSDIASSLKAQNACHTVFQLVHRHGGILREGWKNFIECLLALFKMQTLPKMLTDAEDFIEPSGRISLVRSVQVVAPRAETGLFSSLYSYIALSSSDNSPGSKTNLDEEESKKKLVTLIRECHPELLLSESKFLPLDSLNELVKNLIFSSPIPEASLVKRKEYDEDTVIFAMEVLIKICIQNRDRVMVFWDPLREHLFSMIVAAATADMQYLLERSTVSLLRLALRLMRKEDICGIVLQSLKILLYLRPSSIIPLSQEISFGLHEILKTTAANIHTTDDWKIIFALLEYVGAGKVPSSPNASISLSGSGQNSGMLTTTWSADGSSSARPQLSGSDSALNNNPSLKSSTSLQHSQSQDPIQIPAEYSSGSDRGYTSDSELEIRSASTSEQEKLSPAQSWILLTHNTPEDTTGTTSPTPAGSATNTSSPSKIAAKSLPHEKPQVSFSPEAKALLKSCETLSFLVRDAAHITPDNFTICVQTIRSFVEASIAKPTSKGRSVVDGNVNSRKSKKVKKHHGGHEGMPRSRSLPSHANAYDADYESDPEAEQAAASQHVCIQLLDLLHTLHTRASQIFQWWQQENIFSTSESIWTLGWKPLLQTIAILCSDGRKQIRTAAIGYLQRALLVHDLQQLSPTEWYSCFNDVMFPLMNKLLEPLNPADLQGMEETRMRSATLLGKVFLQHLTPLIGLENFSALWMEILSYMERYMKCDPKSELLTEAIPETLKNLLLVMDTAGVFHTPDGYTKLWEETWKKIDAFLPILRREMFTVVHPITTATPSSSGANPNSTSANTNTAAVSSEGHMQSNRTPQNEVTTPSVPTSLSLVNSEPPSSHDMPVFIPGHPIDTTSFHPHHLQPQSNPMSSPRGPPSPTSQFYQYASPVTPPTHHYHIASTIGATTPRSSSPSPPSLGMGAFKHSPDYTSICFGDDGEDTIPSAIAAAANDIHTQKQEPPPSSDGNGDCSNHNPQSTAEAKSS